MKIIVDAYNVLHHTTKDDYIHEHERKHFINQLSAYAKKKGHQLIAVFDGGPFLFPTSEQQKGITIKYSGPNDTADDIILRYIKEHEGHSMLLVSSDRDLCDAAHYYDVEAVNAQDFYDLLTEQRSSAPEKQTAQAIKMGDADEVVDSLMQQVRVHKKVDDMQDPTDDRQSPARKSSKKERKRMHKIKKL